VPGGGVTSQRMIDQHNKLRLNVKAIAQMIKFHGDFHLKPVWDGEDKEVLKEILEFLVDLATELEEIGYGHFAPLSTILKSLKHNTWFMPAGDTRESLYASYPKVFDWVRDNGYKMTWRPHIIAFEDKREV
jgi:7-carboxy-7-deazaguanine synthase